MASRNCRSQHKERVISVIKKDDKTGYGYHQVFEFDGEWVLYVVPDLKWSSGYAFNKQDFLRAPEEVAEVRLARLTCGNPTGFGLQVEATTRDIPGLIRAYEELGQFYEGGAFDGCYVVKRKHLQDLFVRIQNATPPLRAAK